MVGADFVAFKTNYLDWQTGYAPQLWKTFDTWNTQVRFGMLGVSYQYQVAADKSRPLCPNSLNSRC